MLVYFCSTCGATVPEQSIKSGTAVLTEGDKVHCYKCVTTRVAKVSDSKVYRALLAKRSEGGLKKRARSVSQRVLAQIPTGNFKRVVRRMSERLLGPGTGQHSNSRVGSSPRNRLPAGTAATVASVTRKRSEANSLAMASIACVVLAVGSLLLFMAMSKKKPDESSNSATASNTPRTDDKKVAIAPAPVATPTPVNVQRPEPVKPHITEVPAITRPAPAGTTGTKEVAAPLPPLLTERTGNDFKDQLAVDRLNEAKAYLKENPKDTGTFQKKLNDIINRYKGTPVAEEAAKLLNDNAPPAPPKAADSLDWFANWQVDNLYKHAKAKMYEDFGGRKFVLETHPPEAEKELRLRWKMPVPADKTIFEFSVRADEAGDFDMFAEVDGLKTPIETVRGAEWRVFALDLSARKGQEATVTLHHSPTGWENESAYWQAPQLVSKADAAAKLLVPGATIATETASSADWTKAVNLLPLIDPLKDSIAGTWTVQESGLSVARGMYARTEIPYSPPLEYDLRVTFTRVDGTDNITQILSRNGKSFAFTMGGANNTVFGFETVGGVSAVANPTTVKKAACLENGRKYTSIVQVRDSGIKAWLNGQMICEWKTDYSDMDIYADWKLRNPALLGLGSWSSQAVFHSIEIYEVRGKGKAMHGETKAAAGGPFADVKIEYERTLTELYATLAAKGIKPAIERAEQAKGNLALAPLRSKLELDVEVFNYLLDVRRAALAAAEKLGEKAFTFTKADGKEIAVGTGSGNVIKEVGNDAITIEQSLGTSKALIKLDLDELSAQTQQDLAKMSMPATAASLKLSMVKLARYNVAPRDVLSKEIKAGLDAAAKDPAMAEKAEHIQSHLALLERDRAAQQSMKSLEALVKAKNWREAKSAMDVFKAEYQSSYAYERVRAQLEQWALAVDKETMSPLLKR